MRLLKENGFTLIELMITVAIIAILAAIVLPSYTDYIKRSKITEAVSTLAGMRVKMEQHYQDNRSYTTACGLGGIAPAPGPTANFTFTCVPGANNYLITANGTGSMALFSYDINEANIRTTPSVPPGWSLPVTACWALRKDGSC